MAEKNKTIIEEALIDFKKIEDAVKANSKEILHSLLKEEIEGYVKESIPEDYEEEDIEIEDELPVDGEETPDGDDLSVGDETDVEELPLDGGLGDGEELPMDLDMTTASDDDVIAVYKKLSGDDEIEVVSDSEVKITDPESGNQYVVSLGNGGLETEPEMGIEPELELEPETEPEIEPEVELDGELEMGDDDEVEIDLGDEETEEEDEENPFGESVVYEIELQDDEDMTNEDIVRGQGHDKHVANITGETGDIDGTKASEDSESGDNLEGGFDDDAAPSGDNHADHIMEEDDEEIADGEESIDEKIQVGKGRNVSNNKTSIVGAGGKANKVVRPNVTANESIENKYNALVKEAVQLKKENNEFKTSLKKFRDMLTETVVFNSNLAHVVKIFTEHTTTKDEKKQIINRFDDTVSSLKESKNLYKTIVSELSNKKTVTESVEAKLNSTSNSSKTQITESTAYADSSTNRIKDLIKRVENR